MQNPSHLRWASAILCAIARSRPANRPAQVRFADWLGRQPTRSETACLSRTLASLGARGMLRRVAYRRVRLTATGRAHAEPYLERMWTPGMEE
jgi:DNA-binding HxlR family transcriptional regulator